LNESQIKPALQAVAGCRRGGIGRRARKAVSGEDLSSAAGEGGHSPQAVITAVQSVFQEAGGRMIEVTNRDYQLRGDIRSTTSPRWTTSSSARSRRHAVFLKDIGYLEVGYDQRRSTVDLDRRRRGVGGVAIMEQDQNVLAITRRSSESWRHPPRPSAGRRDRARPTIAHVDLGDAAQFFETLGIEILVLIAVTLLFPAQLRTAIGPIAILLLSVVFTALPLVGCRETINLFSLAGLAIAIGDIADSTIVIVRTAPQSCRAPLR
jgi:Cu(I)/Ag(I) efflux system membrane protein CusA/SilA